MHRCRCRAERVNGSLGARQTDCEDNRSRGGERQGREAPPAPPWPERTRETTKTHPDPTPASGPTSYMAVSNRPGFFPQSSLPGVSEGFLDFSIFLFPWKWSRTNHLTDFDFPWRREAARIVVLSLVKICGEWLRGLRAHAFMNSRIQTGMPKRTGANSQIHVLKAWKPTRIDGCKPRSVGNAVASVKSIPHLPRACAVQVAGGPRTGPHIS